VGEKRRVEREEKVGLYSVGLLAGINPTNASAEEERESLLFAMADAHNLPPASPITPIGCTGSAPLPVSSLAAAEFYQIKLIIESFRESP